MEPRIDVRGKTRPTESKFSVDVCAGPGNDNAWVYSHIGTPLVDLSLVGGVCTLLAYGQTGSGKTHTVTGLLEFIARDLFERQGKYWWVHRCKDCSIERDFLYR